MQIKSFSNTAPKFAALQILAIAIQSGSKTDILETLETLRNNPGFQGKAWRANFAKLRTVFETGSAVFSVFALGGNSKLPFVAFSTLPGVTCPGAGECLDFCYSFRAWRYPAAFARQAQNAYLMRFNAAAIHERFDAIAAARPAGFDFRLYVDGDFSSAADMEFWMDTIRANPAARAYGYSKSFALFLQYSGIFPPNYLLNISSGHNSGADIVDAIKQLPITRGEFRAVSIGRKVRNSDHGKHETNIALRAASAEKIFPCPGKCGTCTGAGHACGLPVMRGRVIAIAMH